MLECKSRMGFGWDLEGKGVTVLSAYDELFA